MDGDFALQKAPGARFGLGGVGSLKDGRSAQGKRRKVKTEGALHLP